MGNSTLYMTSKIKLISRLCTITKALLLKCFIDTIVLYNIRVKRIKYLCVLQ